MNNTGSGDHRAAEKEPVNRGGPPALPPGFVFLDSPADFQDSTAIIVRIPPGIRSKQKLFNVYAAALHFPRYFGWNWDAFEECVNDLSWLPANQPVVIVHDDLPFGSGGENRGVYFAILNAALNSQAASGGRDIRIILPTAARDTLSPAANEPR